MNALVINAKLILSSPLLKKQVADLLFYIIFFYHFLTICLFLTITRICLLKPQFIIYNK